MLLDQGKEVELLTVITSYSIHYTKLYDVLPFEQAAEILKKTEHMCVIVITSYSIHYTKLYDLLV